MITTTTGFVSGAEAGERSLVDQVGKRADVNRDGQISSEEFSKFLQDLVRSIDAEVDRDRAATDAAVRPAHVPAAVVDAVDAPVVASSQGAALLRALDSIGKAR